jgi:putative acetyltransferase
MSLSIRPEILEDVPAIHALTVAAFLNALHTNHNEQFIVDASRSWSSFHRACC